MLSKHFIQFTLFIFLIMGCASSLTKKIDKKGYTKVEGKGFFVFSKEKRKYLYLQYEELYSVKGSLKQVSEGVFITQDETIQSILVDSVLNKVSLDEILKKEVRETLNKDTLFFSNDYKSFIYGKYKFKITE